MFKKEFGRMKISGGVRLKTKGKNPVCQICGNPVLPGEYGVLVKSLGETPREHHHACLVKVFEFLKENAPNQAAAPDAGNVADNNQ